MNKPTKPDSDQDTLFEESVGTQKEWEPKFGESLEKDEAQSNSPDTKNPLEGDSGTEDTETKGNIDVPSSGVQESISLEEEKNVSGSSSDLEKKSPEKNSKKSGGISDQDLEEESDQASGDEKQIFATRLPVKTVERIRIIKDGWGKNWAVTLEIIFDVLLRSKWVNSKTRKEVLRSRGAGRDPYDETTKEAVLGLGGGISQGDLEIQISQLELANKTLREEILILGMILEFHAESILLSKVQEENLQK